jgi:hypothetical protein
MYSSGLSSSLSDVDGAAVCDVACLQKVDEADEVIEKELDTDDLVEKELLNLQTPRKSISQPSIVLLPESYSKVRKKHQFISSSLSVAVNHNSSSESLPSLQFRVAKPEPYKPKPFPRTKRRVRPAKQEDKRTHQSSPEAIRSPSLTSGSSAASRQLSLAGSARSSVSLTLTPLLTSSLRVRRAKSTTDEKWGEIGEAQLEGCFPDRHIRLFVVTWNMQERKVGEVSCM